MKFPFLAVVALFIASGCSRPEPITIVLPIAPGGDQVQDISDSTGTRYIYHYAFGENPDGLVRFHDSVFTAMGLLVLDRHTFGQHFLRKVVDGRSQRWFSKEWITPDSQTAVTFFARERDSTGHLFVSISKAPFAHPPATKPVDVSECLAYWDRGDSATMPSSCADDLRDSLEPILLNRFAELRHGAWREGSPRKARLVIDLVPDDTSKPMRSIIRWADDGSLQVFSPEGRPSAGGRGTEAMRWADSLEQILGQRTGVVVPPSQRIICGGMTGYVVDVPKNGTWEKFEGMRPRAEEPTSKNDSAAEVTAEIVRTMGVE